MDTSRIHNRWPFAKEGIPFILTGFFLTILSSLLGVLVLSVLLGCFTLFSLYFFRDPERTASVPCTSQTVLTPADGRIVKIQRMVEKDSPLGEPTVLISIFMSVFNVHVNRIPTAGIVRGIHYYPGKFFSANLDKASEQNERNSIILETEGARLIVVTQIAGLIARRIVCWLKKGDKVLSGQRFGLIRFGSRLDVFLPGDSQVIVHNGQRVKAGQTIIGYLS